MDKKELKKYIYVPKIQVIFVSIFTTLLAFCLTMLFVKGKDNKGDATLFDPIVSQEGEYVYLDATYSDDWIYNDGENNVYYGIVDYYGYYNNVVANENISKKINKAHEKGETYRIYGTVQRPKIMVTNAFCEVYGMSSEEYYDYFGDVILNTKITPNSEIRGTWAGLSTLVGVFEVIVVCMFLSTLKRVNNSLNRIEERHEIEKAKTQLDRYFLDYDNKGATLLDDFIYNNPILINYEDIIWTYVRIVRYNFVQVNAEIVINTAKKKNIEIPCGKEEIANQVLYTIKEKNKDILIGFTKENKQAYKEIRKKR